MFKRILLVFLTNILVIVTLTIVIGILSQLFHVNLYGFDYPSMFVLCLVWGMGGAFISLSLSRIMAKWMMGVHVIDPNNPGEYRSLVNTVHRLAERAGLTVMPQVGVYDNPDLNAFATGPSKNRSLVSVSTGLLERMTPDQIEGVLGHEVTHIRNGDMVTMTLIQGVINAFVMFFARIVAFAISTALRRGSSDRESSFGGFWMNYMLISILEVVFGLLGFIVVARFSRWREFRADKGGAEYAGRGKMISALQQLQLFYGKILDAQKDASPSVATLKISGKQGGFLSLMATHPPLEERIARLQAG